MFESSKRVRGFNAKIALAVREDPSTNRTNRLALRGGWPAQLL